MEVHRLHCPCKLSSSRRLKSMNKCIQDEDRALVEVTSSLLVDDVTRFGPKNLYPLQLEPKRWARISLCINLGSQDGEDCSIHQHSTRLWSFITTRFLATRFNLGILGFHWIVLHWTSSLFLPFYYLASVNIRIIFPKKRYIHTSPSYKIVYEGYRCLYAPWEQIVIILLETIGAGFPPAWTD